MKQMMILTVMTLIMFTSSNLLAAGDVAAGKTAYAAVVCSTCHGANGEGNEMFKAPKLAGQHAWYTLSALQRFKSGARGSTDPAAATMVAMAANLTEEQMVNISAYLATL